MLFFCPHLYYIVVRAVHTSCPNHHDILMCSLLTVGCIFSFLDSINLCSTIVSKNVGPPFPLFGLWNTNLYSCRFAKLCCNT
jgi:hypothetical protein